MDHLTEQDRALWEAAERATPDKLAYLHALANPEAIKALLTRLAEAEQAKRALLDLTPGGSEFVDNIHNCKRWVEERLRSSHELLVTTTKRARDAETRLDTATKALGALHATSETFAEDVDEDAMAGPVLNAWHQAMDEARAALAAVKGGPL